VRKVGGAFFLPLGVAKHINTWRQLEECLRYGASLVWGEENLGKDVGVPGG